MRVQLNEKMSQAYGYFAKRFRQVEEDAVAYRSRHPGLDKKLIGLVVVAALCETLMEYFGQRHKTKVLFRAASHLWSNAMDLHQYIFTDHGYAQLSKYAYWSFSILLFYGVLPYCYLRWVRPRTMALDLGLGVKGALQHWRIYLFFYVIMLVIMFVVSDVEAFQKYYPFYKGAGRSMTHFVAWELLYLPTFIAVEFFFRGVLIFPFAARLGAYSILIPIMPYCMIHFGKPVQETIGAIVAGLLLGALALATRSIWLGVAIHVSVALTMDLLSLWRKGTLPFLSW
tara:strand:- start:34 stop:885 length:852 start_codon:yes stop_codon:yes gene_type:complete